jgi:hypothetical protein
MLYLQIKLSKSFQKALLSYSVYKTTTVAETEHYIAKINFIRHELIKIAKAKKHLSKKVSYRNSNNLNYFTYQQHIVFFKITETELQVKYFVAAKRIKTSLI